MESEIRNLSTGKKIALWLALVWVVFCLLGAFGNSWYLVILVCLAMLAAIFCLFKNILDAKYTWIVFAASLILPFMTIGFSVDPEENDAVEQTVENKEEVKTQVEEKAKKEKKEEKKEKEEKEQERQMSTKEQEVANAGFKRGTMFGMAGSSADGFSDMLDLADYVGMNEKVDEILEQMAGDEYDREFQAPTSPEEKKLKKIYIENFIKAMNGTMDTMDNLEKLGGKRK